LKLGGVLVAYARVMMVGPGGVGKTSFLRGLMKKKLLQAESTILADTKKVKRQFWAKAGESTDSYWAEVTEKDEIKELAGLFQLVAKSHPSKAAAVGESNPQEDRPQSAQTISDESVSSIEDSEVQNVLQQVAEYALHHSQNPAAPQSEVLIHVWDCGGQPVFLDVLPAFLTSRTMFLLFFDARQNLHEKCKTLAYKEGKVVSKSDLSFTTLQLLTQWMASVHTMYIRKNTMKYTTNPEASTTPSEGESSATQGGTTHAPDAVHGHKGQENSVRNRHNCGEDIIPKFPRILPVGTHGDEVEEKEKKETLRTLLSHCKGKAYIPLLLDGVIVDNTTAGRDKEHEDKGFKDIREEVHQFASKDLAVATPVAWVLFRKVLRKVAKGSPIVSYEQAVEVGKACRIAENVVPSVLDFYHELAVFLHYTQIESLSDEVIVDPQWLVKQLGKLLAPEELRQKVSNQSLWEPLDESGILVQHLYEEVWKESKLEYNVQPRSLVRLLEHFLLAAPIDPVKLPISATPYEGPKYFVPSVLKFSMEDTDNTPRSGEIVKRSSPLHLTFSTQYVPPGFFTRLATTLTGKREQCEPLFEQGVYCNKITFRYGEVDKRIDELMIFERSSSVQIEVVRTQERRSHLAFRNTCLDIVNLIKECSVAVCKTWLPSVEVKAAFLCEQCPGKNHFITIGATTNADMYCEACHHCNLTKEKKYWLKIPSTPEVCCLCRCYWSSGVGLHVSTIAIHQQCIYYKYCALLDGF